MAFSFRRVSQVLYNRKDSPAEQPPRPFSVNPIGGGANIRGTSFVDRFVLECHPVPDGRGEGAGERRYRARRQSVHLTAPGCARASSEHKYNKIWKWQVSPRQVRGRGIRARVLLVSAPALPLSLQPSAPNEANHSRSTDRFDVCIKTFLLSSLMVYWWCRLVYMYVLIK
nr:uncharacterized protein LOC113394166 [Vanessa tameamea]